MAAERSSKRVKVESNLRRTAHFDYLQVAQCITGSASWCKHYSKWISPGATYKFYSEFIGKERGTPAERRGYLWADKHSFADFSFNAPLATWAYWSDISFYWREQESVGGQTNPLMVLIHHTTASSTLANLDYQTLLRVSECRSIYLCEVLPSSRSVIGDWLTIRCSSCISCQYFTLMFGIYACAVFYPTCDRSRLSTAHVMNGINKKLQQYFGPQACRQLVALRTQIEELNNFSEDDVPTNPSPQRTVAKRSQSARPSAGANSVKSEYCSSLLAANRELEKETDELRAHLRRHQHVVEEVRILQRTVARLSLSLLQQQQQPPPSQSRQSERDEYWGTAAANLEPLNKCMQEAAEKRKELEREFQATQILIKDKEAEINQLQKYEAAGKKKTKEETDVLQAQSQMRELKKLGELQAVKMEELHLELTSLQRQAVRSSTKSIATATCEVQTSPESGTSTPDSSNTSATRLVNGDIGGPKSGSSKSRMVNHKNDSGLGSSLDESVSSRKDQIAANRHRHQLSYHPLAESVDRASMDHNHGGGGVRSSLTEKNPVSVFVTRFSYIPAKHSPNESTLDQELELKRGEYVIVYGDMDEDGFYDGESVDGRRGYVPSNLVERLPPHELIDFYASHPNNPLSRQNQQQVRFGQVQSGNIMMNQSSTTMNNIRPTDFSTKVYATKRDTTNEDPNIPAPRNLVVEKEMHKSIMIGWKPAQDGGNNHHSAGGGGGVESYNIYVDGILRNSVRANERCRALIEGMDLNVCHRISIRSCVSNGRESIDQLCTLMVGKNCPMVPDDQKVINILSNSVTITWRPANSSFQHCIYLNDREYATVPASQTRFTIPELTPSTVYRVRIVPVTPSSTLAYSSYALACPTLEFKTLPDNVPDPPAALQLESGPQDGTLLLSWTPVVPQPNCDVTGYAIYADGQKVHQIDSPTGDHTVLDITHFPPPLPRNLSVRTMSSKAQSRDSPVVSISEEVLLGQIKAVAQSQANQPFSFSQPQLITQQPISSSNNTNNNSNTVVLHQQQQNQMSSTPGGPFNRQQNTVTFREQESQSRPPSQMTNNRPPPDFFMGDDLPDIQEEREAEENAMRRSGRGTPFGGPRMMRGGLRSNQSSFIMREPEMMMRRPGPGSFMDFEQRGNPRNMPPDFGPPGSRRFDNMSMSGDRRFAPGSGGSGPGMNRYRPGPPNFDRRSDFGSRPPFRGDAYPGFFDDEDYLSDHRDRFPEGHGNFLLTSRTSSLPQIEITKDDSFESMDSRHRAFSDRDTDPRMHARGPRSRFNSPPNESSAAAAYRRQRSQSRDRLDDGPRRPGREMNSFSDEFSSMRGEHRRAGRDLSDSSRREDMMMGRSGGGSGGVAQWNAANPRMDRPGSSATLQKAKNKVSSVFKAIFDPETAHGGPQMNEMHDGWFSGEEQRSSTLTREGTMKGSKPSSLKHPTTPLQPQSTQSPAMLPNNSTRSRAGAKVKKMVALYDYDNKTSQNPDPELELSFREGDIVWVSGEIDDDGFYRGELNGKSGLVPSNFLTDAPPSSSSTSNANKPQQSQSTARSKPESRSHSQTRDPDLLQHRPQKNPSIREPSQEVPSTSRGGQYASNPHLGVSGGQLPKR